MNEAKENTKFAAVAQGLPEGCRFQRRGRGYAFIIGSKIEILQTHIFYTSSADDIVAMGKRFAESVHNPQVPVLPTLEKEDRTYSIETKEIGHNWNDTGFRFRMVCTDGRRTGWAPYTQMVFLGDIAAHTDNFNGTGNIQITSLQEAMALFAVGEEDQFPDDEMASDLVELAGDEDDAE